MVRVAIAVATLVAGLGAQQRTALPCRFAFSRATLDYGLRYRAAWSVDFPLKMFEGERHHLAAQLRIVPDGRSAITLREEATLPTIPRTRTHAEFSAAFFAGEGRYTIDAELEDEQGRGCQHEGVIQVIRGGAEGELEPALPAGSVAREIPLEELPRRMGSITVLLHAVPSQPGAAKLEEAEVRRLVEPWTRSRACSRRGVCASSSAIWTCSGRFARFRRSRAPSSRKWKARSETWTSERSIIGRCNRAAMLREC